MSAIDGLVAELCPDGVEYKRLSEMGKFVRGKRFVWKDVVPDGKPCIHYSELYTTYGLATKKTVSHLDEGKYEKLRFANPGDVVIVGAGETVEDIGIGVAWLGTEPAAVHDACYIYKHGDTLDPVFISYYLRSGFYHNQITRFVSSAKISSISADNLGRALIPVPPIEVQREIVRILDAFTELTDTMTEELEARKAQYAHYRDRLLSLESLEALDGKPVEMVRLGDVCVRQKGMPITAAKMKELASEAGNVVVFGGGKTKVLANRDDLPKGNVIETPSVVVKSRGNIGFEYCDVPFTNKNELWSYAASSSNVDIKFIYHYLDSRRAFFQDAAKVGKLPQISTGITDDFQVSLPSLETQQKIVDILDRFDALTTSLTDGLPAEIEARKAQYGYYRDRLLDFPRKEAAAS